MRTFILLFLLCATSPECSAKAGKGNAHISSIYINTPDSSVKASVTDQSGKHIRTGRTYHWYASNQLCVTNGAYSGRLLHGAYSSFYPNHFLLAQGQFRTGLKDGCWKRWLPDGSLHEVIHYKNGQLHGAYELYAPNGYLMQRIYYRKGARAGKTTIFSQDKKDSVIMYKKGLPKEEGDGRRETGEKKRGVDSVKKPGDGGRETGEKKSVTKKNDSTRKSAAEKAHSRKRDTVSVDSTVHFRDWILSGKKIFSKKDSANISKPVDVKNKNKPDPSRHSRLRTPNSRLL